MIPKVIHYCWFGENKIPPKIKRNIKDWKKKNPDYKFVKWDENNFDLTNTNAFVKEAAVKHKWAFVSDFVRLYAIYSCGGVYLDTDVKLLKSLDELLKRFPNGYMGFESQKNVNSGLGFAAQKGDKIIEQMIEYYAQMSFDKKHISSQACPIINTTVLKKNGLNENNKEQVVGDLTILPNEYLSPLNIFTGEINITANTYSIHMNDASWMNTKNKAIFKTIVLVKKILPSFVVKYIEKIV